MTTSSDNFNVTYAYSLGLAFHAIANRYPDRLALRLIDGGKLTYRELDRLSNRMARGLLDRGLGRRDIVGIFNSKSPLGFAAMLAALKLGAAYVNLDDQNPSHRIDLMLRTCRPRLILTDGMLAPALADISNEAGAVPVTLSDLAADTRFSAEPLAETARVVGSDPAYLMFTSGSTGVPKGVMIAHQSVLNFINWSKETFDIQPNDILTNVNPIYFDNSVFDFYSALFSGAALVPIPRDIVSQPARLISIVEEMECTLWFSVPSLLIYLMTLKQLSIRSWPSMRQLVFGGEGYPKGELKKLFDLFGQRARLVNVYGPTECTCICSAYRISKDDLLNPEGLPPLGKIANNFAYTILGDDDRPVALGEAGELCLLGPQIGLGYCNAPERTSASFVSNPQNTTFHERMYRSGDLVRQDNAGMLWFVGRKDNQIKHMGYRIELEEIEAALNTIPTVTQSAAVYQRVREQHGRIVAFVAGPVGTAGQDIRKALRNRLPEYMIPDRILILADLPKNANGKIDRVELLTSCAARSEKVFRLD